MTPDKKCEVYARECVRLADLAKDDPELHDHLIEMARLWMGMAVGEPPKRSEQDARH
jgi:hypothetical protein